MRSLYITNFGLMNNLAKTQILAYLEGIAGDAAEIFILSYETRKDLGKRGEIENLERKLNEKGIRWTRAVYHNRWGNIVDVINGWILSWKIISRQKIDVLHARASIPIFIAWSIAKLRGKKLIYDRRGTMVGDLVDDVNVNNIFSLKLFANILESLDKFMIRQSDATIVLSKKMAELIKKDKSIELNKRLIVDIPCCTDIGRFTGSRADTELSKKLTGKFVLSYLGSLGTCYCLNEMLDFFNVLKAKKKETVFLIISHTDRSFIDEYLNKKNIAKEDCIVVSGAPDDVPGYLKCSEVTISFVRKGYESGLAACPTKFAESLACGVPVIVNNHIGDTGDIVLEEGIGAVVSGFGVPEYERAIDKIDELLKDKDNTSKKCVNTAKKYFSLDLGRARYKNVYNMLAEKVKSQKSKVKEEEPNSTNM